MKHVFVFVILFFSTLFIQANSKAIKTCFKKFQNALATNNGAQAFKNIDSNTIIYFDKIKYAVDTANADYLIKNYDILQKYFVLALRAKLPVIETKKWRGDKTYKFLVENAMFNKDIFKNATINFVEVEGNYATASFVFNKNESSEKILFVKEKEVWKLDMEKFLLFSKNELQQKFEKSGMHENDFLLDLIQKNTHQNVSNRAWLPLNNFK